MALPYLYSSDINVQLLLRRSLLYFVNLTFYCSFCEKLSDCRFSLDQRHTFESRIHLQEHLCWKNLASFAKRNSANVIFCSKTPMVGLGRRRRRFGKCLWLVIGQSRNLPEWPLRQQRGFPAFGSKQKQKNVKILRSKEKWFCETRVIRFLFLKPELHFWGSPNCTDLKLQ